VRIVPDHGAIGVEQSSDSTKREAFLPGAFKEQLKDGPPRVWLTIGHGRGLENIVGHAVKFMDFDSLFASFRVHSKPLGDKALELAREGVLGGVSMTATPLRSRVVDGVRRISQAHLMSVALVGEPAYPTAKVLTIRQGNPHVDHSNSDPSSLDELYEWELERLDGKLKALARCYIEEWGDSNHADRRLVRVGLPSRPRANYMEDERYKRVLRLRERIAAERAPSVERSRQAVERSQKGQVMEGQKRLIRRDLGRVIRVR
jgi:HK97 family phage prohead protease